MTSKANQPKPGSASQTLRQQAEEIFQKEALLLSANGEAIAPEEYRRTLHDLQVHQIELELQNEELRRTQADLDVSQARYFDFYDLAPVGYVTLSAKGLILDANLTAAQFLGVARRVLIRQLLSPFIRKEDQDIYYLHHQKLMETGEPQKYDLRMARKDQTELWMQLNCIAAHDAEGAPVCRIVLSDITWRIRANKALRKSEERYRELVQNVNSAILCLTDDGVITFINDFALNVFGYSENEIVGKKVNILLPPHASIEGEHSGLIRKMVLDPERFQYHENENVCRDGRRVWMHWSNKLIFDGCGQVVEIFSVGNDITDRKQGEMLRENEIRLRIEQEQLQAANSNLERSVEQRTLELQESQKQYLHAEKLSAIGLLSASIAHEFNNPLQGILSVLNGVKKRAIMEEEDKELMDAAIAEGDRIKGLIRNLQDFNRPSSGKKIAMDVHYSLDSILLLQKSDFNGKRIAVERIYAEGLPQIMAVSDQIKQVLLNLLANAADACRPSGGVITVSTWQEDARVAMAIKDTGTGITPENMEKIFQPFYSTKGEVKGTGLGLSVSHGIIQDHQGEIRVESQPGEGTTFTVLLPIKGTVEP